MRFEFVPTLETQRQLYSRPRDMQRFQWYMQQMMGPNGADVLLPITLVNPMGKEHCLETIEWLIEIGAEEAVKDGIAVAESKLESVAGGARVSLNLLDDLHGGWTERYSAEAGLRFGFLLTQKANRRRRFIIVPAWSSERPTSDFIYAETLAACYRQAWRDMRGLPRTLAELVEQEGAAMIFASIEPLSIPLSDEELAAVTALYDEHHASNRYPVQFAFFFGDEASETCGIPPLGAPLWGGLDFALRRANQQRIDPVAALHGGTGR